MLRVRTAVNRILNFFREKKKKTNHISLLSILLEVFLKKLITKTRKGKRVYITNRIVNV